MLVIFTFLQMMETLAYGPIFRGPVDEGADSQDVDEAELSNGYKPEDHLATMLAYTENKKFPKWMVEQASLNKDLFDADGTLR